MYKFTLSYHTNSVNNSGLYDIVYDKKLIHKGVEFPFDIFFKDYKPFYQVEVTRTTCGTKKIYNLNNVLTTTFNIPNVPKTTVPYIPPTTTQYVSTTEAPITTTVPPTTLNLSYVIKDCYASSGVKFVNVSYNISGFYNGSYKFEIRSLNGTLYYTLDKPSGTVILRREAYLFVLKDTQTNAVIQSITTPILNCPTPSFVVSYVPNTVGKKDAKLEINNISNTSRLRWCYGSSFTCSNNFETPDHLIVNSETSVTINTNTGVDEDYVSGDFITVRGFGLVEDEFFDYTVTVTPATALVDDKTIKVVTLFYDNGVELEIKSYLVKNGKKVLSPTDVSAMCLYSLYESPNVPSVTRSVIVTVTKGTYESVVTIPKLEDSGISFFCVDEVYPTEFETTKFINNNPC